MDADGNYITEDMQEGLRRAKELIISIKAILDCEGIDVGDTKGKITHIETDNLIDDNYTIDDVLKIIDYIMRTCSEMDLQTKTPEEIFEEYNEKY